MKKILLLSILAIAIPCSAQPVKEVDVLVKCVANNTVESALDEINQILLEQDTTEYLRSGTVHIRNFNSSAPAFSSNGIVERVCVTLTRKN